MCGHTLQDLGVREWGFRVSGNRELGLGSRVLGNRELGFRV